MADLGKQRTEKIVVGKKKVSFFSEACGKGQERMIDREKRREQSVPQEFKVRTESSLIPLPFSDSHSLCTFKAGRSEQAKWDICMDMYWYLCTY